jgi:hypothetical protein
MMKNYEKQMIHSLDGIIKNIDKAIGDTKDYFKDSIFDQRNKTAREFHSEVRRIVLNCKEQMFFLFSRRIEQDTLEAIYYCDDSRITVAKFIDEIVENSIIPRLKGLDRPGDTFSCWMQLKSTTKEFSEIYNEIAKHEDMFWLIDVSAICAILSLVVQAENCMENGYENEAWINLIDASYWLGSIKGGKIGFHTGKNHGWLSSNHARAKSSAEEKNAPFKRLQEHLIKLVYEKKPKEGWKSITIAAKELQNDLNKERVLINGELTRFHKKNISKVTTRTIIGWLSDIKEEDKKNLFLTFKSRKS